MLFNYFTRSSGENSIVLHAKLNGCFIQTEPTRITHTDSLALVLPPAEASGTPWLCGQRMGKLWVCGFLLLWKYGFVNKGFCFVVALSPARQAETLQCCGFFKWRRLHLRSSYSRWHDAFSSSLQRWCGGEVLINIG